MRNLMSDDEWLFFEPFLHAQGPKSGRPPSNHRLTLDGIFWIARTGAPWRGNTPIFRGSEKENL